VFEQSVITPLRAKVNSKEWFPKGGATQQASNLWRDAFFGTVAHQSVADWNDFRATLDIHGHWLVEAAKAAGTESSRLAEMLDGMVVERIQTVPTLAGLNLTLNPPTPNLHARQFRMVTEPTERARTLTLFLGRVALEVRNFIEHGIEVPDEKGLLVRNEEMWQTKRDYVAKGKKGGNKSPQRVSLIEWIRRTATDQNWPRAPQLPAAVPAAASGLLLDAASLGRCLVLVSLLVAGSHAHLQLR
jgi:hypothetical protein